PVRGKRVGAEREQVVGAVDVRDRNAQNRPEHEAGGNVLRHLIDGGGGVDVPGADGLREHASVYERLEVVCVRVSKVERHGVAAAFSDDGCKPAIDLRKSL